MRQERGHFWGAANVLLLLVAALFLMGATINGSRQILGKLDFGSTGTMQPPTGTAANRDTVYPSCVVGDLYMATDVDGGTLQICIAAGTPGTWKDVDDDGAAGGASSGSAGFVQYSDGASGFLAEAAFVYTAASDTLSIVNLDTVASIVTATGPTTLAAAELNILDGGLDCGTEVTDCVEGAITASSTDTLTNKTYDCAGTGNVCHSVLEGLTDGSPDLPAGTTINSLGIAPLTSPVFLTSLALPQGAAPGPVVDAAGEIAVDTDSDQLVYYGSTERVLAYDAMHENLVLESPADADSKLFWKTKHAITITDIDCIVDPAGTGESVVIDIRECDGTGDSCATVDATITCDNDGAADDGDITNDAIDAGDWLLLDIGTVTGTVTDVTVTVYYTVDRT